MPHRAEQIIDRVVAVLVAASVAAEKHRILSYDPNMELPAISVQMGHDAAIDSNIPVLDSELMISIVCIVSEATEAESITKLMELRTKSHVALMADRTLGLSFVSDVRYAGAARPEFDTLGEKIAFRQESQWIVPYRMNLVDPQ